LLGCALIASSALFGTTQGSAAAQQSGGGFAGPIACGKKEFASFLLAPASSFQGRA
jgi:hypothetical protein